MAPKERKAILFLEGLDCATDCPIIERVLKKKEGIIDIVANFVTEKAYIRYNPEKITLKEIEKEIKKLGFEEIILENGD